MKYRSWMYNRNYPNRRFLREEFIEGVKEFITHAMSLEPFRIGGLIRCPCVKCKCLHFFGSEDVKTHLYKKGFMDNYFVWIFHGEIDGSDGVFHNVVVGESSRSVRNNVQHPRYHEMVADAFEMHFPEELAQQMFNQFKTKCVWEDRYNREICASWEYKCRKRLSDSFSSARKVNKKPSWVLPHLWEDLQRYWITEKFEKQSELRKKARASEKGDSLHCVGSRSMRDTRRQLGEKYGRKMTHDEFSMETHIRKKKAPTDPSRWVEDQAETAYGRYKINVEEYTQRLPSNEQGERPPISDEEAHMIWLDVVGGPKKGIACDLPEKSFRRYKAGLQGIGTSAQGEAIDKSTILSMEQKIAKLTAELEETKAREQKRDEQFGTLQVQLERRDEQFNFLQGQLANLLASGAFPVTRSREPSPCADDEGSRSEDGDDAR